MTLTDEMYACLYAREFSLQAILRLRPELRKQACVVMVGEPPLQQVAALNRKARSLGIAEGMTRVELDTFSSVIALPRSRSEEESARAAALECAGMFSPRIEDRSDGNELLFVLDIQGMERLCGPPDKLARALLRRVNAVGLHASIAICGNVHASIALARGMPSTDQVVVVPRGEECAALSTLPPSVLDLSEAQSETLTLWGIHSLGMLAELPEKALIARMGQEGRRLRDLARGELPHLFEPVEPGFHLMEHMELDIAVEVLDSLLFVIGLMLEQLIVRATARVFALASVSVVLSLEGGSQYERTVRPALPANDKTLWLKLIHLDLEAHPPPAAILALTLMAEHGKTGKVQLGLFSPQLPEPMRLDVTLARIRAIVGEECVGRAQLRDTHSRERYDSIASFSMERFRVPASIPSEAKKEAGTKRLRTASRLIRPAESISVTLRNKRPERFFYHDTWYAVEHAYGPWLASGDWWNPMLWSHEQWDLVGRSDDGALLCCCLLHDLVENDWRMAALYD